MHKIITRLQQLANFLEQLNERIGRAIAWLTVLMVLVIFLVVVLRYVFNTGWIAMQESSIYLHAMVFMFGAAYTLRQDGHVRVDIFYRNMSQQRRAWVDLLGTLLLMLPMSSFILLICFDYVAQSWSLLEASPEAGGLPLVFLLKSLMLLMPMLLILQGFAMLIRQLLVLRGINTAGQMHPREEI